MNPGGYFLLAVMVVTGLSALIALSLSARQAVERPVKVMMFVGYFWLAAFIQLLMIAAGFYGTKFF